MSKKKTKAASPHRVAVVQHPPVLLHRDKTIKRGLEGVIVPSKMYGILAAGKPILAVAPEETDVVKLGDASGFAISADPVDASNVADAVRRMVRDPELVREMGEAARVAANDYDRVNELRKFVQLIEEARSA